MVSRIGNGSEGRNGQNGEPRNGRNGSTSNGRVSDLERLQDFPAQKLDLDDRKRRIERIVACTVTVVILVVIGLIAGALFVIDDGRNDGVPSAPPTGSPTMIPFVPSETELKWVLLVLSKSPNTSFDGDGTSPQRRALKWIANDPVAVELSTENWSEADKARILQRFALATIWYATTAGGRDTTIPKVWLGPTNECTWNEPNDRVTANDISCTDEEQPNVVTKLALAFDNLQGTIPAELGLLTSLTYLFLGSNRLQGSIPSEIGRLVKLKKIFLGSNDLQGTLPTELFQCTDLLVLDISSNRQLQGPIPHEIRQLTQLQELYLYDSPFLTAGSSLPSSLCNTLSRADTNCDLKECDCCTSPWPDLRPC